MLLLAEPRKGENEENDRKSARRRFLKIIGITATVAMLSSIMIGKASETLLPWLKVRREKAPERRVSSTYYIGSKAHKWVMVIDLTKCIACGACIDACSRENTRFLGVEVPLGARTRIAFIDYKGRKIPMHFICQHCDPAPCVEVCPTGASIKREDGIVLVDYNLCIGCKYCMSACPYGARYVNGALSAVDKCTFCAHRVDKGLLPACVEACPVGARIFGDLKTSESKVSKIIRQGRAVKLRVVKEVEPNVYYIYP